jgi:DNA mismatch endonuclease, patch repair protein
VDIAWVGAVTDVLDAKARSALMARIRGKHTRPELAVRKVARSLGLKFHLHRGDLPGSPDLVFVDLKKAVFVNGCFWHRHHCGAAYSPKTRPAFWASKFEQNVRRDRRVQAALRRKGWGVLVIWECETRSPSVLERRISTFMKRKRQVRNRPA